jgi:hypothetical protein
MEGFMRTLLTIAVLASCAGTAASQQLSNTTRAEQLAASFTKHKDMVRQKAGVTKDKYLDVQSEPVVRTNVRDYAGAYEVPDLGFLIDIQVGSDGSVVAQGHDRDANHPASFRLDNPKIENAVLTGRKVYANGATEPFEAVFLTRTEQRTRNGPVATSLGLGVLLSTPFEFGGVTYDRLFYQLKR